MKLRIAERSFAGGLRAIEWSAAGAQKRASRKVLALHGWLDNAASFERLAPRLVHSLGATVVALDLHGHGASAHRPSLHGYGYSADDHANTALGVLHELEWQREEHDVTLLGHSMGAAVTLVAASMLQSAVQFAGTAAVAGEWRNKTRERALAASLAAYRPQRVVLIEGLGAPTPTDDPVTVMARAFISRRAILHRNGASAGDGGAKVYANLAEAVDARLQTIRSFPGERTHPCSAVQC
jgi:pimeloyl-ACP methyl ester carboxylesterase